MHGEASNIGQLALMDAMVFFVASLAITGVLFSLVVSYEDSDGPLPWFDARRVLAALLLCSVGPGVEIVVSGESAVLPERTEISECILLEARLIAFGDGDADFAQLDARINEVLRAVCSQWTEAQVRVMAPMGGNLSEVFAVPGGWTEGATVFAATAELVDSGGSGYLVQLRSSPSTSPEGL